MGKKALSSQKEELIFVTKETVVFKGEEVSFAPLLTLLFFGGEKKILFTKIVGR